MAILPAIQEFLDQINALKLQLEAIGYKVNQTNIRESLARLNGTYITKADMSLYAIDDTILNEKYPIPIRTYLPKNAKSPKVAIFCHGGGNTCGSITVYDTLVRNLVNASGMVIVSIDYRLSPEFAYPTSINDCKKVIENIFMLLDGRGIKYQDQNLALIGDSGGGAIAAAIVTDRDFVIKHKIKAQVLIYPALDYTLSLPSLSTYGKGYLLETTTIAWYNANFFQNGEDLRKVSPLYSEFYPEMPASLVILAGYDPLQDEGHAYYNKLVGYAIPAELLRIEGVVHAYLAMEDLCPEECGSTYLEIGNFLAKHHSAANHN